MSQIEITWVCDHRCTRPLTLVDIIWCHYLYPTNVSDFAVFSNPAVNFGLYPHNLLLSRSYNSKPIPLRRGDQPRWQRWHHQGETTPQPRTIRSRCELWPSPHLHLDQERAHRVQHDLRHWWEYTRNSNFYFWKKGKGFISLTSLRRSYSTHTKGWDKIHGPCTLLLWMCTCQAGVTSSGSVLTTFPRRLFPLTSVTLTLNLQSGRRTATSSLVLRSEQDTHTQKHTHTHRHDSAAHA